MPGALKVQYIVHYFHSHKKEDEEEKKRKTLNLSVRLCMYYNRNKIEEGERKIIFLTNYLIEYNFFSFFHLLSNKPTIHMYIDRSNSLGW